MGVLPFPEPTAEVGDRREVLLGYLDWLRATAVGKLAGLTDAQAAAPAVPSGWSPVELLHHLTWVERRWLEWGFEGRPVPDPWGDEVDGRWDGARPATLERVLLHLVQEYARHVGHLDIARELLDGTTGE